MTEKIAEQEKKVKIRKPLKVDPEFKHEVLKMLRENPL